jgi:hypothetical protein
MPRKDQIPEIQQHAKATIHHIPIRLMDFISCLAGGIIEYIPIEIIHATTAYTIPGDHSTLDRK